MSRPVSVHYDVSASRSPRPKSMHTYAYTYNPDAHPQHQHQLSPYLPPGPYPSSSKAPSPLSHSSSHNALASKQSRPPVGPRRHTVTTNAPTPGSKPIRSSPLAGPALSRSPTNENGDEDGGNEKGKKKPRRISSFGDLLGKSRDKDKEEWDAVTESTHTHHSSASSHSHPGSSGGSPTSTTSASSRSSTFTSASRATSLTSIASIGSEKSSRLSKRLSGLSLSSSKGKERGVPEVPKLPEWVRSSSTQSAPSSPLSSHSQPFPVKPETQQRPVSHRFSSLTAASGNADWMTANTYGEIPRFSRLGVAGSGVVMPVRKASADGIKVTRRASMISQRSVASERSMGKGKGKERAPIPEFRITPPDEVDGGMGDSLALSRSASGSSAVSSGSVGSMSSLGSVRSVGSAESMASVGDGKLVGWMRKKIGRATGLPESDASTLSDASSSRSSTAVDERRSIDVIAESEGEDGEEGARDRALAALEGVRPTPSRGTHGFAVVRGARGSIEKREERVAVDVKEEKKKKGGLWRRLTSVRRNKVKGRQGTM